MAGKPGPKRIPGADQRCIAKRRLENGEVQQCKRPRMVGLNVCYNHGGATKASRRKHDRAKLAMEMQRFVKPLSTDDPEADPVIAFETEFRRTLGRIRWYDEQMAKLSVEDLSWGKSKEEDVRAAEFGGVNTTFEARANTLHELQFRERTHLTDMTKIWIGAKLDEKKLDIQRAYVMALDSAMTDILKALGHDVSDPGVRQVVRDRLLVLQGQGASSTQDAS